MRFVSVAFDHSFSPVPLPLRSQRHPLLLPLAGERVAAGFPSPADDYVEVGIDLNDQLIRHPTSTFFLRVSGDSMTGAHILDGDLVVLDSRVLRKSYGKDFLTEFPKADYQVFHLPEDLRGATDSGKAI